MANHIPLAQLIEADVSILLCRALLNQKVIGFGEDGMGKYGRNDYWKSFMIDDIDIDIIADDVTAPTGTVRLRLAGYDSADCGDIATDGNLTIAIKNLLKDQHIDPECLSWAPLVEQGENYIALNIDVPLLMDWA
jgi:hypothetical protein